MKNDIKKKQPPVVSTIDHRLELSFNRFRLGVALFFVGFVILYGSDQLVPPSLIQELLAGLAVLLIAIGFGLAFVAELLFIGYRVWLFFTSK